MTKPADSASRCVYRTLQFVILAGLLNCVDARGQTATPATSTIQPAKAFSYPAIRMDLIEPAPDGQHVIVQMDVPAINIWSLVTFYWPEVVVLGALCAALIVSRRVLGRKQTIGEYHCGVCNYQLTALTAVQCPECGAPITRRMKGRYRAWRLALVILVALSYAALYFSGHFEALRVGDLNQALHWCSPWMHKWAEAQHNTRILRHQDVVSRIVEIDPVTGAITRVIHEEGGQRVSGLVVLHRDQSVLAWGPEGIWRYELATGRTLMSKNVAGSKWLPHWSGRIEGCWLDPSEHTAYVAVSRNSILQVDLDQQSIAFQMDVPTELEPHYWRPPTPFVSQDPFLAQRGSDEQVRFWMLRTTSPETAVLKDTNFVNWGDTCTSADGSTAYIVSNDRSSVEIWNMRTGLLDSRLIPPLASGTSPAVSRDGRWLFLRSPPKPDIQVYDLQSGKWAAILLPPTRGNTYGCVMSDGKTILMTGDSGTNPPSRNLFVYTLP